MFPADAMVFDVLLVGGSPSNLVLAHHLITLAEKAGVGFSMGILEKAPEFGAHCISGAVSNPRTLKKLFPDGLPEDFPIEAVCKDSYFQVLGAQKAWTVPNVALPSGLHKEGYNVLTLSHVVKWLADKLPERATDSIMIEMLPGFAAHQIVYHEDRVIGVQIVEKASGNPAEENIYGKITCFGDKGFVSRDLIDKFKLRDNPQIWSVGVKEVWDLHPNKDYTGKVWHTMGYPLSDGTFGGGFIYGMKDHKLTIGLIMSLDSPNPNINPQQRLQDLKKHPWIQDMIRGGKMTNYGAALLPEGGYYSLPKKFAVDGAILLGDALGVLDVSALSGVDKSMESGFQAAEVLIDALQKDDFSETTLSSYQTRVMDSYVGKELYQGRYFRKAWQENPRLLNDYLPTVMAGIDGAGPIAGLMQIGLKNPLQSIQDALRLKSLMDGNTDIGPVQYTADYKHIQPDFKKPAAPEASGFDQGSIFSRPDAVFYAHPHYHEGNLHIDEFNADVCVTCISRYDSLGKETPCVSDCTAEVHRIDDLSQGRRHGMSLENCIQCRTCEIVCPEVNLRVRPAEQGSGPNFMGL